MSEIIFATYSSLLNLKAFIYYYYFFICANANLRCQNVAKNVMIGKSKGSTMLGGPLSIPIFQNNFVLQDFRNVLQFASGSCCKLRRPTIVTKGCSPCYKMCSFHLLQNAQVITKCHNPYYKMCKLLQNVSLLQNAATLTTKCVSCYKMRRYYKMLQNRVPWSTPTRS